MRTRSRVWMVAGVAVLGVAVQAPLAAQSRVQAGVQLSTVSVGEFDARDTGVGVQAGVRAWGPVWAEAALIRYAGEFPGDRGFSQSRVEGLFGASAGPTIGRLRPFAKAGAGFLRYGGSGGPVVCIAIFPPPLSCELAAGRTLQAYEIGGGLEILPGALTFARLDVSRRVVRYPGPSFTPAGGARAEDFHGRDLRLGFSAGLRF
ncbi:MAG: hypothetical protein AB7I25_00385 [Vicinamibacterales bacterium]